MTTSDIKNYLDTHTAINLSAFCRESNITTQYLGMILRGERPLTDKTIKKITPVMVKYGYGISYYGC